MMESPRYTISPEAIANGINDLLDELEEEKRINKENLKLIDDLQNKIDSAIEYILELKQNAPDEILLDKLIDILKGSDN